jgi:hypothetical protein
VRTVADLVGKVFWRLTVTARSGHIGRRPAWDCICTCGKPARVTGDNLRNGKTRSCGCYRREVYITNMQRSKNGAKVMHRLQSLEEALAEVARTWPQRLQEYAREAV